MKLEIWSDVVCPWCAIGRARLRTALAGHAHRDEVTVRWRSFELEPDAPRERGDGAEHLASTFGVSVEAARRMQDRVAATAAQDGLEFHVDRARHGNTADAHRLLHHAWETGGPALQDTLKGRLLQASFTDGEPIGDPGALARIAVDAGLDDGAVRDVLGSDRYLDDVRADEDLARRLGITSVPFLVVDDRYGVAGAQPVDALRQLLDTAWAERGTPARS
ncbi:DsbA family oxidoreductase [Pseudonocardia sp. ICBG1293]|uniref:DsbA family oxidoreductase n=1 Tax=Pseudonocardia sp. ICBG1293 TaxID=2844382 RepID=UPI001CC984FF|nr:DsbA family oxidoreductase [Pseudonocardia sp. ICBG1293]